MIQLERTKLLPDSIRVPAVHGDYPCYPINKNDINRVLTSINSKEYIKYQKRNPVDFKIDTVDNVHVLEVDGVVVYQVPVLYRYKVKEIKTLYSEVYNLAKDNGIQVIHQVNYRSMLRDYWSYYVEAYNSYVNMQELVVELEQVIVDRGVFEGWEDDVYIRMLNELSFILQSFTNHTYLAEVEKMYFNLMKYKTSILSGIKERVVLL